MTTITIDVSKSVDITASIERVKLQLADRLIDITRHVPRTELFPNMTQEQWKMMITAEWVDLPREPESIRPSFNQYWVTRELLEDSRVPIETIFGYKCRCVVSFDEPEFGTPEYDEWERRENQKAMDAFWAERPTR